MEMICFSVSLFPAHGLEYFRNSRLYYISWIVYFRILVTAARVSFLVCGSPQTADDFRKQLSYFPLLDVWDLYINFNLRYKGKRKGNMSPGPKNTPEPITYGVATFTTNMK